MVFWKKQKEIESGIQGYLDETEQCITAFLNAFDIYFKEGLTKHFEDYVTETHRCEARCDNKRREIEETMYGRALIPEFRGDILAIVEGVDLVPNKCESVLFQVWLESIRLPQSYSEQFKNLVHINGEAGKMLCTAARFLFNDIDQTLPTIDQVCDKEGESDQIERGLIKTVFDAPGDKAEKIQLKELILQIGDISDRAEDASDRLRLIAVKRHV